MHHTPCRSRRLLHNQRNGQPIVQIALPQIKTRGHVAVAIQAVVDAPADLALGNGFAGSVLGGVEHRLPGIVLDLLPCQTQRIPRNRLVKHIGHQRQAGLLADRPTQAGIGVHPGRLTVDAPALGRKIAVVYPVVEVTPVPGQLQTHTLEPLGTQVQGGLQLRRLRAIRSEHLQDTPCRIAIQLCQRPAEHFNSPCRRQADGRGLPLPVRHGCGYAIHDQSSATDAE